MRAPKKKSRAAAPPSRTAEPASAEAVVSLGELDACLSFFLRIAQSLSFQSFAEEAHGTGIRAGYFTVLALIGANPGITQTALSRANGRDKSSLTPVLDELVRRGLVSRNRLESNRRAYALKLTALGKTALLKLRKAANRHERHLRQALGKSDSSEMSRMLKVLSTALTQRLAG